MRFLKDRFLVYFEVDKLFLIISKRIISTISTLENSSKNQGYIKTLTYNIHTTYFMKLASIELFSFCWHLLIVLSSHTCSQSIINHPHYMCLALKTQIIFSVWKSNTVLSKSEWQS